ncbi:hypothetical protein SPRG_00684 [Saprolegnia parasitica CBS 223.65]|uniref:Multiple inositol polyphosphate phosphatase 1 n=1 Tax=Saprolegnia parasitica (strain CBS 223.65) TaxID=695850 RepID=A0A067D7I3_SAPPC|nr:hypothetical protein SPRG_00684 [Saprolegnia parasitica CBS 223.65]KDO34621.1 hypothetical protein SPRG_00684 [Saprolegnia parasitica CBS 223.65]|eukprot:XP_012194297.1 hypothetical protein SPRG_00684 [Saprolegnia parasitica CBS 223.65]
METPRTRYLGLMRVVSIVPITCMLLFASLNWRLVLDYVYMDREALFVVRRWTLPAPAPTPFSTKTRYDAALPFEPHGLDDLRSLPQCKLVQMNALLRHGTRYPMAPEFAKMQNVLVWLQSTFHDDVPAWLQAYNFSYDAHAAEGLAPAGIRELADLGQRAGRLADRLGLSRDYTPAHYVVEHTHVARTKASAIAFANAYFTNATSVTYVVKPAGEDVELRFFDNCPRYLRDVRNNKTAMTIETKRFEASARAKALVDELHRALQLPPTAQLSFSELKTIYDACSYDVALFHDRRTWCRLFSVKALRLLDFYADLKKYYECGTGYEISYAIAAPLLAQMLRTMEAAASNPLGVVGYFRFAHAETVLPLVCLLGLCTDTKLLAAFDDDEIAHRVFNVAAISPFAGNVVFHLFACGDEHRVQLLLNERLVRLPSCGEKGYCTLPELRTIYAAALTYNFTEHCRV